MAAEGPTPAPAASGYVAPGGRPVIAQRTLPPVRTDDAAAPPADSTPTPAAKLSTTIDPMAKGKQNVLFARKGPMLSVETLGPRRISVGKEAAYEVTIHNSGEVAADEVVVFVDLPEWADVLGAEARTGATQSAAPGATAGPFQWKIGHLPANGRERLVLRIVPRESRPFDLAVRWDYKPGTSQAMIEVQEPKLVLNLEGPREVLYGKKEIYRLKVSNTGNGDAENVLIKLMPIGTGGNQSVSHNLGVLKAGTQKAIEVELTARQVGSLMIQIEVRGDGGVHAELAEKVLVRRAALQVHVDGPKVQYVGAVANYRIRVSNPGTAPAENVKLSVSIPPGAKYLSGIDGSQLVANGTKLQWTLKSLNAASEQSFVLKCSLGLPGSSQLEVVSTADGDLTNTAATTTRVEAMADLVLDVKDPTGPVPVGQETTYELRIRNRGTKNANNVEVVAYFSHGIEPTKVEGGQHRIAPGQVVFGPIPTVAAGEDLLLKIYARAEAAGNHIFRAEVHCKSLGTRLVSEETTHFYKDDSVTPQRASSVSSGKENSPAASEPLRTVERQRPTVVPHGIGPSTLVPPPESRPTPAPPRK